MHGADKMAEISQEQGGLRKAGYSAFIERYELNVIPNYHVSTVASGGTHRITSSKGVVEETYPSRYWPGNTLGGHLEFALKYDGTNLGILATDQRQVFFPVGDN